MSSSTLFASLRTGLQQGRTMSSLAHQTNRQLRRSRAHLVDRFLSRQEAPHRPSFLPEKSPVSGCWRPGSLSLRRQAQLANTAYEQGRLQELPSGSRKVEKLKQRMVESESILDSAPTPFSLAAQDGILLTKKHMDHRALVHAKQLTENKGPYAGRKGPAFKGTKQQRQVKRRKDEVKRRLDGMEKLVENWRSAKKDARDKARSTLPF